jgi:UMF1 family MFS transporter
VDKRALFAWALYDFANTIFSMNVVSRYFPLWVTKGHGAPDLYFSLALSASMLMVAVTSPALGAISDDTGKRVKPLLILTVACVIATAAIGFTGSLLTGLVLFAAANYCYQSALVFYGGLLLSVAGSTPVAKVSGYGAGVGYLGAVAGLLLLAPVEKNFGPSAVYLPTALLFILFAMPLFLWVKDAGVIPGARANIRGAFRKTAESFRRAAKNKNLSIFLIANFFILDAVNTVIAFMSIYANTVIGLDGMKLNIFLITSTVGAVVGSLIWGSVTSVIGPRRAMIYVCKMWIVTFLVTAFAPNETVFWLVGPLAGSALGGVWVSGRTLLIKLAPKENLGECFGLYNVAGKAASISGPLVWGVVVYLFSFLGGTLQHRLAVLSLTGFIGVGLWLLKKIEPGREA